MPPPPPKPGQPAPDDERRKDAAAEADRLGREHSNKREMKARAERIRSVADDARPPPRPATGVPGAPQAPVLQPRQSRPDVRIADIPRPEREPRAERPEPRAERPEPRAERAEPRAERAEPRDERQRSERADDAARAARLERPARQEHNESRPPREERRERPRAPREEPQPLQPNGVIDEVAVEAEEFLRDVSGLWRRFSVADKITVVAAFTTLFGTFLPWLWRPHEEVVIGLGCGGVVHALIACTSVALLVRRDRPALDERGLRPTPSRQRQLARRTALWQLLLSLLSTVAGTWFLLVYGAVRRFEVPSLEVGAGLYVALAAGLGLSYSGFAFFWRANKEGRR